VCFLFFDIMLKKIIDKKTRKTMFLSFFSNFFVRNLHDVKSILVIYKRVTERYKLSSKFCINLYVAVLC